MNSKRSGLLNQSDAFYTSILRLLPWSPNVKDGMYTVREYGVFRTRKTVHSSYEIKTL